MTNNKKMRTLISSRGDFLLSSKLVPTPDEISYPDPFSKKREFTVVILDSYLKFLELVVTNQRILDVTFSTYTEAEAKAIGKDALEFYLSREIYLQEPKIKQNMLKELEAKNIYFPVIGRGIDYSPRKFIDEYLNVSPRLKDSFKQTKKATPIEFKKNAELLTRLVLADEIGIPLSVIEFAKQTSLPFALHRVEIEAIKEFESTEINLRNGVLAFLKEKLNQGAQKELTQINELGNKVIYPETPIAWQIIRDSSKLEDFLPVALQLREEYKTFRETTIKIEEELFSDETTLKRKEKLVKELNLMASEIWKGQENTTQRIAQDFSSLLDLALNQATNLSLGNFPKLLDFVLGKPTEILLSKLHQRKIKVLMNSKKQFMSSRKWINKLSSIFSLPEDRIREGVLKFHKTTKT